MRSFFAIIASLIFMLVIIDFCGGQGLYCLMSKAKGGDTWKNEYIAKLAKEDIIIMGSSRAIHHYNPLIIEQETGKTCYNIGDDGYGIILFYGKYRLLQNRYTPKCIVYDIEPHFDINTGDEQKYLSKLRPYYDYPGIDSILWSIDSSERYKCISKLYRFNSKFAQIIGDNIKVLHSDIKGYRPFYNVMDTIIEEPFELNMSSIKMHYMESLMTSCRQNHTQLVIVLSPVYRKLSTDAFSPVTDLATKYQVPILDHLKDSTFISHREWFNDSYHLNHIGADTFSAIISQELINLGLL